MLELLQPFCGEELFSYKSESFLDLFLQLVGLVQVIEHFVFDVAQYFTHILSDMSRDELLYLGPSVYLSLQGFLSEGIDTHAEHLGCLNG
jgi:hypothetical protein